MNRLTNRAIAEELRNNIEQLKAVGIEPNISDLRYIKLAEYENSEERKEKALVNYDTDEWYE